MVRELETAVRAKAGGDVTPGGQAGEGETSRGRAGGRASRDMSTGGRGATAMSPGGRAARGRSSRGRWRGGRGWPEGGLTPGGCPGSMRVPGAWTAGAAWLICLPGVAETVEAGDRHPGGRARDEVTSRDLAVAGRARGREADAEVRRPLGAGLEVSRSLGAKAEAGEAAAGDAVAGEDGQGRAADAGESVGDNVAEANERHPAGGGDGGIHPGGAEADAEGPVGDKAAAGNAGPGEAAVVDAVAAEAVDDEAVDAETPRISLTRFLSSVSSLSAHSSMASS